MGLSKVSVLLSEPVAAFEFGVAVEVFGLDRSADGVPKFDFRVCSNTPGKPLAATNNGAFSITAPYGLEALRNRDLVIIPPIREGVKSYPEEILDALRAAYADGATLLSVCTGAFVLAASGLLDGRPCTTHWMYVDELAARYPSLQVDPNVLFVDDGQIITSAGTAAGIDACLHLVRRELGSAAATTIARRMVVPPQRDGGQQQFIDLPMPEQNADRLAPLLAWILEHLDSEHSAESLAKRAMMSPRTFARRFTAETGTTPHRWLIQQRLLAARELLEETDLSVEQIASRIGFNSPVVLREHFRRQVGIAPLDYRRRFAGEGALARTA